jgi:hypothetical protein
MNNKILKHVRHVDFVKELLFFRLKKAYIFNGPCCSILKIPFPFNGVIISNDKKTLNILYLFFMLWSPIVLHSKCYPLTPHPQGCRL